MRTLPEELAEETPVMTRPRADRSWIALLVVWVSAVGILVALTFVVPKASESQRLTGQATALRGDAVSLTVELQGMTARLDAMQARADRAQALGRSLRSDSIANQAAIERLREQINGRRAALAAAAAASAAAASAAASSGSGSGAIIPPSAPTPVADHSCITNPTQPGCNGL